MWPTVWEFLKATTCDAYYPQICASRFGKTLWEYQPDMRALLGYEVVGDKKVGGYVQVMERVEEFL